MPTRPRILSGVQPSGKLHLGNYFGAIQQHIALQHEGECFFFIADYHSMTTLADAAERRQHSLDVALDYLALGLDPAKVSFFRQSDVPEVCELAWILGTVSNMGLLERAHSYKDKIAQGVEPSVGLFTYPVLMAADILIYRSQLVPVGEDQVQHLEIARDLVGRFHRAYHCDIFPEPQQRLVSHGAKVPGVDGTKMSKSKGNTIDIFGEGSALKKRVMGIVTNSTPVESPKDPETCSVFALYRLVASAAEATALAERYRAGGMGYGEAKKLLLSALETYFAPARERRKALAANPEAAEAVLMRGAERARAEAQTTLRLVREAVGFTGRPVGG